MERGRLGWLWSADVLRVQLDESFGEDQAPKGPLMGTTRNGNAKFYKRRFKYKGARRGGGRGGEGPQGHSPLLISPPHAASGLQSWSWSQLSTWSGFSDPITSLSVTQAWAGGQRHLRVHRKPLQGIVGPLMDGLRSGVIYLLVKLTLAPLKPRTNKPITTDNSFLLGSSRSLPRVRAQVCTCVNVSTRLHVLGSVPPCRGACD